MNKNVSVWRGPKTPPTNYHVWINEKNEILLHNGSKWEMILDDVNYEDLKQHLATVATTGNYNDLKNKPSIASTTSNGLMSAEDKSKLNNLAKLGDSYDLNTYTEEGVYIIRTHIPDETKNYPIQTPANSVLRLTVTYSYDGNTPVIVQVLNINNNVGGEGGIYIRSCQGDTWKPWAKLQTNVEVGLVTLTALDNDPFLDNGIFSGVCSDTGETFVLICINNYAVAPQNKSIA